MTAQAPRIERAEASGLIDVNADQKLGRYLSDVWDRREYLRRVPLDDLRAQNFNTVLGNIWHLLNPMLLIGVYYLIFGLLLRTDRGIDNFIAFLAIGVFVYQLSQRSALQGAKAITRNEGLIRSIRFPRAILPLTTVISETLAFIPGIVVMFTVALATGEQPLLTWLLLPLGLLPLQFVFNVGAACITARANDIVQDVENFLPYIFRIGFYMSGVLFAVDARVANETIRALFALNPLYSFISLSRTAVLGLPFNAAHLLSASIWSVALLIVGFWWFRAGEHTYGRG